jgi:hypothetical protein
VGMTAIDNGSGTCARMAAATLRTFAWVIPSLIEDFADRDS